uniref:Calponin-homology (CH) domain-containing protein n=1 Tax=Heterorhabditis bacteriophora TaxID=37862 RepID=A0A1I7WTQ3_HETBA
MHMKKEIILKTPKQVQCTLDQISAMEIVLCDCCVIVNAWELFVGRQFSSYISVTFTCVCSFTADRYLLSFSAIDRCRDSVVLSCMVTHVVSLITRLSVLLTTNKMTEEQKIVQETVDKAPELPTTEPPKDDVKAAEVTDVVDVTKTDEKAEEIAKEEKSSKLFKRPTLRWGKKRDEPAKEPEQVKDIREDALGWISQQIPPAVHKVNSNLFVLFLFRFSDVSLFFISVSLFYLQVNYHVLDWAQKMAVEDESKRKVLPGKDGMVTRNQFLAFLRDGKLLSDLANKLQPGAIKTEMTEVPVPTETATTTETVIDSTNEDSATAEENRTKSDDKQTGLTPDAPHKSQKEIQQQNIEAFTEWAKNSLGLDESKVLTAADLLGKGKAGYPAVFETLWQLAIKAQEKFQKEGIDVDAVIAAASQAIRTNILQTILNFFKRPRPSQSADKKAVEEEEKAASSDAANGDAPNAPEGEQIEEECKKMDSISPSAAPVAAK